MSNPLHQAAYVVRCGVKFTRRFYDPTSANRPLKEDASSGIAPSTDCGFQADSISRNACHHAGVDGDSSPSAGAANFGYGARTFGCGTPSNAASERIDR